MMFRGLVGARGVSTLAIALAACVDAPQREPDRVTTTTEAIIKGEPSPDSDNATVRVLTSVDGGTLQCTGTLLAPNLVMTARHCTLQTVQQSLYCNPDGTLADITDPRGQDVRTVDPSQLTVYVGSSLASLIPVRARQILTEAEIGLCKSDMAFVVLETNALDTHLPLRKEDVLVGLVAAVAGWGRTGDSPTTIPSIRYRLASVPVSEVGPGLIPADSFAVAGDTLCFGDSGSAAIIDGAVAGVYSRIEGPSCELTGSRNVFTGVAGHKPLIARAFDAAGTTPWYAGDPEPWLGAAGASCNDDAACQSHRCVAGSCATLCGNANVCASDQICGDAGDCVAADAGPVSDAPHERSGCSVQPNQRVTTGGLLLVTAALVCAGWTSRRYRARVISRRRTADRRPGWCR